MRNRRMIPICVAAAAPLLFSAPTPADSVPYVPTPEVVVEQMLSVARVTSGDLVYDLGSGDGRIVVAAARRGARAIGVDNDPARVREARQNAARAGVSGRAQFFQQDLFAVDLRDATVVTLYLLPGVNLALRPRLLEQLRPGARVVSHDFDMGEWEPDQTIPVRAGGRTHMVYHWVVPASVAGTWTGGVSGPAGEERFLLRLDQSFQEVSGSLALGGRTLTISEAKIAGRELRAVATDGEGAPVELEIRFDGQELQGAVLDRAASEGRVHLAGRRRD